MRFSLRTLMLLFALVAITYSLSYFYARSQILGSRPKNLSEFGLFQQHFSRATDYWSSSLVDVADLNACVQGGNAKNSSYQLILDHGFEDRRDPWGNYFQWVALDENNQPLPNVPFAKNVGLYSKGPDGISESSGNDPDDYNTWNTTDEQYQAIFDRGLAQRIRQRTLQTMPGVFFFLLVGVLIYRNRHQFRRKPVPYYNRDERPWAER